MEKRLIGITALLAVCLIWTASTYADETRANPRITKLNTTAADKLQKQSKETICGTTSDLSKQVEVCAKPLMDLIEGTVEKWPRTDDDAMKLCESFNGAERCIREASRKCGKGLQKTIISTLANSIQRARKRECSLAKAPGIVKTTMCVEKNQGAVKNWIGNVTARLSAIELQAKQPEKIIAGVCCMVHDIQAEIKTTFEPFCPAEGALIGRLYRAVLQDVIEIVCNSPKCNNYMREYKVTKNPNSDGIVSIILRMVLSLDT